MKKIVVAGFGFMGRTHAMNVMLNPNLELVALVDKDIDGILKKLKANSGNISTGTLAEEDLSNVRLYAALKDCLLKESPDACIISVHTDLHYELARTALEAGVNVFLEKPFSLKTDQCKHMIELAEGKNLLLMIGHVVRFMPAYRKLREWITNRDFGILKFLALTRFSGLPLWGQWKEKQEDFGSSGGALFDLVIHDIDFAHWVLGKPDEIKSTCLPGRLSQHDYVNACWQYKSGLCIKIEGGNIFHSAFPFQAGFSAGFEQASILYSSLNPLNIQVTTDTESTFVPVGDANEGFSAELQYFTECLRSREYPYLCSPESALKTIELCYKHIG
jgi:predicted dehydrogenase